MKENPRDDKAIFVYFNESKDIPELIFRFYSETYALEVWPYLGYYYMEIDGSRTERLSAPEFNFKQLTLEAVLAMDKIYEKTITNSRRTWRRKRHKMQMEIDKWLRYFPKDKRKLFQDWPVTSLYTWKALKLSIHSQPYFQLCQTNPILAYRLIQKELWNDQHPLMRESLEVVLVHKPEIIAELVGIVKKNWKIIRKLQLYIFQKENFYNEFDKIIHFVEDPYVQKIVPHLPSLTNKVFNFLNNCFKNEYLSYVEISFLLDLIKLENNDYAISKEYNNILDRFGPKVNMSKWIGSILRIWEECIRHNKNWRIKNIQSLLKHEIRMINDLNRLNEESIAKDPEYFMTPPFPWQDWNQGNLFDKSLIGASIHPIKNNFELLVAGKEFQNCSFSYLDEISLEIYYIYIIKFENGESYMAGFTNIFREDDIAQLNDVELDNSDLILVPNKCSDKIDYWRLEEFNGIGNQQPPDHAYDVLYDWLAYIKRTFKQDVDRMNLSAHKDCDDPSLEITQKGDDFRISISI
ncbi:hypothetical protein [Leptospira sp. GIMC2001]|uniref:hypothetical protein n=1 Tax=Leptospira sp. GIMC2001 TaxID=1513297 RepID=UPI00234A5A97|nr:hypothetical protein [Leptospira sp. GIMC2001]WCL50745.1 hypothetical protein O4O04_08015 [Leptospira sp. GIMC2001]